MKGVWSPASVIEFAARRGSLIPPKIISSPFRKGRGRVRVRLQGLPRPLDATDALELMVKTAYEASAMNAPFTINGWARALTAISLAILGLCSQADAQTKQAPVPAVTNFFYSPAGEWIKASNADCVLWNSFPREGESVTWSGGILNGKAHGKGTVQWFTNGVTTTRYVGDVKDGLADGQGIAKSLEAEFEGEWSKGSLVSTNSTIRYADGNSYRGPVINGVKSGHGEETMKGGQRYVGQFKDNRFHGQGELFLPNGDKIAGEWKNSKLEGTGTYHPKEGEPFKVRQTETGIERL
jgi:hypothetical protein